MTARRSIAPDAFELRADGTGVLIGGWSPTSGRYHFPQQDCCPYTGATDVERVELADRGALWGWTAVTAPPPGYDGAVPYGFGVVELTRESLRVITRLSEPDPAALTRDQPMRLVPDVVARDDDGTEVVVWAFAPELP